MAFKLLTSGRPKLIAEGISLLPLSVKINAINENGFTALMLSCISGDEAAVLALLDAGADPNVETPATNSTHSQSTNSITPTRLSTGNSKSHNLSSSSSLNGSQISQNNNIQPQVWYSF